MRAPHPCCTRLICARPWTLSWKPWTPISSASTTPESLKLSVCVKIASQKILLHHFYYPFRSVHHWDLVPLVAAVRPRCLHLNCVHGLEPHDYFDGCYAQKRERLLNTG